jgi:UDP-N-acetylglucosamine acyltransferase
MPILHPTALVHPTAYLAEDVVVGAYAIVEAEVQIAAGTQLSAHSQVLARTVLGERCLIGHGAIIGGDPQSVAFDTRLPSRVVLGNGNRVREHVTIHRSMYEGKETIIGDDNFFMAGSHVGHDGLMGSRNVIANNVLFAGHVEVGSNCFFGGASVFHQFIRVGDYAMAQGKSGFSMDVPPFMIGVDNNLVAGLNVVGMKRAGFTPAQRLELKRAFDLMYRSGRNITQALAAAQEQEWTGPAAQFVAFIAGQGKKGVCALRQRPASEA